MLPPSEIFDQAHNEAIILGCLNDNGGNHFLAQSHECLQPALTADEVITGTVATQADRDWLFQPKMRDAGHQFVEDAFVAGTGIQHRNGINGNLLYVFGILGHAALLMGVRAVSWKKRSRVSNRYASQKIPLSSFNLKCA